MLGEAMLDVSGTFAGEAIRLLVLIAAPHLLTRCYVLTRHRAATELVLGWRSDVE